jgi:hypothetical protein
VNDEDAGWGPLYALVMAVFAVEVALFAWLTWSLS